MENHECTPVFKYPCEKCTFVAIGFSELLEHMDLVHTNALASCSKCDYKTKNQNDLDVYIIDNHAEPGPGPIEREQHEENLSQKAEIKFDQCDFVATGVPEFIKHIRNGHMHQGENCKYCDYLAASKHELKNHMNEVHSGVEMIYTMAKQVNDLSESFGSFETFKSEIGNTLKLILENHNSIKQELFVIRNKQVEISASENKKTESASKLKGSSSPTRTSSPKKSSTAPVPATSSTPATAAEPTERKTLLVGDSISANVNLGALEIVTQSTFTTARAYSTIHDTVENPAKYKAKFPKSNFAEVVPAQLSKDKYQNLIMQAGSVDITNLNTKDNPSEYIEYFKQETVLSARRFF